MNQIRRKLVVVEDVFSLRSFITSCERDSHSHENNFHNLHSSLVKALRTDLELKSMDISVFYQYLFWMARELLEKRRKQPLFLFGGKNDKFENRNRSIFIKEMKCFNEFNFIKTFNQNLNSLNIGQK